MGKLKFSQPVAAALILAMLVAVSFTNCQVYQTGADSSLDDQSKNLDKQPEEVAFEPPLNVQRSIPGYDNIISFGGVCTVADTVDHYLEFTMRVERSNGDLSNPVPISSVRPCSGNTCVFNTEFKCEHGKYNVYLPIPADADLGPMTSRSGWKLQIDGALYLCKQLGRVNCESDSLLSWNFVVFADPPPP